MTIGEYIRKARTDRGYSRQQLSNKSGVSVATIRCWEDDLNVPSVILLSCIADALNISLDELIGRKGEWQNLTI